MTQITENTVNDLIAENLRTKHMIDIVTQVSTKVPAGRRQPDFQLDDKGSVYYGEGEWQDKFSDGYDQAIEFGDIPNSNGYFLLGYSRDISKKLRSKGAADAQVALQSVEYWGRFKRAGRPVSRFRGPFEEIPVWIKGYLAGRPPKEKPEAFLSFVPSLIDALTEVVPHDVGDRLGYEPFMALMGESEGTIAPEVVRHAAAYILLDQIVFHRILANRGLRIIDSNSIKSPKDIQPHFDEALEINYQPIFGIDVLSILEDSAVPVLRKVVRLVNEDQPETLSGDILGNMWHELIPLELRKPLAAYYTNVMAARFLARLVIKDSEASVADFACGSGTLLVAAYERKRELLGRTMTKKDHERFLTQLTGIDVMVFSAHLAVVQLALRSPKWTTDEVRIAIRDSTPLKPGDLMKPIQDVLPRGQAKLSAWVPDSREKKRWVKQGVVSTGKKAVHEFRVDPVDVVLMNPPFTRQESIPDWLKKDLPNRFSEYDKYLHGQMGFGGYFIFLADRFLKPGGRIGFVLPSTVLRLQSYEGVRQILIDKNYDLEYVITTDARSAFSESTAFREILLIAREMKPGEKPHATKFVNLKVLPSTVEQANQIAGEIENA
jgi:hypothetical protein